MANFEMFRNEKGQFFAAKKLKERKNKTLYFPIFTFVISCVLLWQRNATANFTS